MWFVALASLALAQDLPAPTATQAVVKPLPYRVFAGGGAMFGESSGGAALAGGFHRSGKGRYVRTLSGAELIVMPDGSDFNGALPADQALVAFASDFGVRLEPFTRAPASPWIGAGMGYALLLPVLASGLQGFGGAGVTFAMPPDLAIDVGAEFRVLYFGGDPTFLLGGQAGVRF